MTALMVGVAVGRTIISSSEYSGSSGPSDVYSSCLVIGLTSGRDDLLEVGSSHIWGGELTVSTVDDTSHVSRMDRSRVLLAAAWLKAGDDQVDVDGPGVSAYLKPISET